MTPGSTSLNGLALDARSLDALRRDASADPSAALRQAAGQFEALFLQQLLKSMRDAMPKSGMFGGPGHDTYVGMLDQQLSQSMANRPGGLAEIIARQLERNVPASSASARASASADGSGNAGANANVGPISGVSTAALRRAGDPRAAAGVGGAAASRPAFDAHASLALKESLEKRLDAPQVAFVERMWPHAIAAQRTTGVPAAFVVGQAALESGWGRHEIRHADGRSAHNLFGIKATGGWDGATVEVTTTEYVDGRPVRTVEKFRAYASYAEGFRDWASLMSTSPRYGAVLRDARSAEGFAQGLQRAGYATDPQYGDKLERTINRTLLLKRLAV